MIQTFIVVVYFIISGIFNGLLQLWGDSIPNYPNICGPLHDIGFIILPSINTGVYILDHMADLFIIISLVLFILYIIFGVRRGHKELVFRRFLLCWSLIINMRTLSVAVTRYPRLPAFADNYTPANIFVGALLIIVGVESTVTDMMFSGHTSVWIIIALFTTYYANKRDIFHYFMWIINISGIVLLIAAREHYTADVIIGIFISTMVFLIYHFLVDTEILNNWDS